MRALGELYGRDWGTEARGVVRETVFLDILDGAPAFGKKIELDGVLALIAPNIYGGNVAVKLPDGTMSSGQASMQTNNDKPDDPSAVLPPDATGYMIALVVDFGINGESHTLMSQRKKNWPRTSNVNQGPGDLAVQISPSL